MASQSLWPPVEDDAWHRRTGIRRTRMTSSHAGADEEPRLNLPRSEVEALLQEQIEAGRVLLAQVASSEHSYADLEAYWKQWFRKNVDLLRAVFDNDAMLQEYCLQGTRSYPAGVQGQRSSLLRDVREALQRLQSIHERLSSFEEIFPALSQPPGRGPSVALDAPLFLQSRDPELLAMVERFLHRLGLQKIIAHLVPRWEKQEIAWYELLEGEPHFVLYVLTPEEESRRRGARERNEARASQEAVFQLGFFVGRLSSERVCALIEGNLQPPRVFGLEVIDLDGLGAWRTLLLRALREAGYPLAEKE